SHCRNWVRPLLLKIQSGFHKLRMSQNSGFGSLDKNKDRFMAFGQWRTFGKLIVALVTGVSIAASAYAKESLAEGASVTKAEGLRSVVKYQNQFTSLWAMINELQEVGTLTKEEASNIMDFLAKKKVDVEAPFSRVQLSGTTIHWGKLSLSFNDDGTLKTQDGR